MRLECLTTISISSSFSVLTIKDNAEPTPVIVEILYLLGLLRLVAVVIRRVRREQEAAGHDAVGAALLAESGGSIDRRGDVVVGGRGKAGGTGVRDGGCNVGIVGCGAGDWDREVGVSGGRGRDAEGEELGEGEGRCEETHLVDGYRVLEEVLIEWCGGLGLRVRGGEFGDGTSTDGISYYQASEPREDASERVCGSYDVD
jgi:hypothetical protein